MKFSIKYFFCKCDYDQSWSFVQFHSYVTTFWVKMGKSSKKYLFVFFLIFAYVTSLNFCAHLFPCRVTAGILGRAVTVVFVDFAESLQEF